MATRDIKWNRKEKSARPSSATRASRNCDALTVGKDKEQKKTRGVSNMDTPQLGSEGIQQMDALLAGKDKNKNNLTKHRGVSKSNTRQLGNEGIQKWMP